MKLKFVGFVQSKGEFKDDRTGEVKPFDSITLDCLSSMSVKGANVVVQGGQHYKKVKFKTADLASVFDDKIKVPEDLVKLVGKVLFVDGTVYSTKSGQYIDPDEISFDDHS